MADFWTKVKAGAFFIIALLIGVLLYFWFVQFKFARKSHHYKVKVKRAAWVQKGTLVTVNGVPKGRVEKIELYPDSVLIYIRIEDYALMEGARATVENQGVMGERRIEVYLGQGDTLPEWTTIPGDEAPTVGDLIAYTRDLLRDLDSLAIETRGLVKSTSERVKTLEEKLSKAIDEIAALSAELRASGARLSLKGEESLAKLDSLVAKLDTAAAAVKELAQSQGTLQRLATEDKLYIELEKTLKEAQALIEDIRSNPEKYIRISIF